MREFNINFNKTFKPILIIYTVIFIAGIIFSVVGGVNLDINFSGGTKISYSYTGEIAQDDFKAVIDKAIKNDFELSHSTSIAGDTKTYDVTLVGKNALSNEEQKGVLTALTEKFKDNKVEVYNSNSVSASLAGTFFLKSFVAIAITAILVVIYVGFRFRRIGGVSAALTALVALVFDVLVVFFTCVFFGLQIDLNFIAVVLTMLGYSLNDTIVIYDRIRENERINPHMEIGELVNMSVNKVLIRNIVTTVTTILAVLTIVIVSELYGLSSLRTFAIPMAFGLVSGSISSVFISGPLWVIWKRHQAKKNPKKKA